jgi:hypothetical protein
VKDVDGTITVDEEREKKRKLAKIPTIENSLMTYINAQLLDKDDNMDGIRKKMELWINANNYTTQSFIESAFARTRKLPPDDLHDTIEGSGGLELLLHVYCDVRDKFIMGKFVEVCESMGVSVMDARLLFLVLQKIRDLSKLPIEFGEASTCASSSLTATPPGTHQTAPEDS